MEPNLPGPSSVFPELTAANQAAFNAGGVDQAAQAGAQQDQAIVDRQNEQSRIAEERSDPNNYRVVRTATGGMRFIDPTGQEVSVDEYAQVTGQTPAGVLQDSEDPQDRQFVDDYLNLQTTIDALYNEDAGTLQQMQVRDPEGFSVLQQYTQKHGNLADAADSMMNDFMSYYGNYYGQDKEAPRGDENVAPRFAQNIGPSYSSSQAFNAQLTPDIVDDLSPSQLNDQKAIEDAQLQEVFTPQDVLGTTSFGRQRQRQAQEAQQILERRRQGEQEEKNIWNLWGYESDVNPAYDAGQWARGRIGDWFGGDSAQSSASGIGNTAMNREQQNRISNARQGDFIDRSTRRFLSGRG